MNSYEDVLDDLLERWHFGEEGPEDLPEFLGMDMAQFDLWAKSGEVPEGWEPPAWA
jgi:hypothetical protein